MLHLVMEGAGLTLWPAISLLVFFGTTLGMLVWIYRPGSAAFYRQLGQLALEDKMGKPDPSERSGDTRSTAHNPQKIPSEN